MRKIISILVLTLFCVTSFAQIQLSVGVKGGLNSTKFDVMHQYPDKDKVFTSKVGYHAGVFAQLKISKFAVQPEVVFSQQGSKFEYNDNGNDWESDLTYINIPVMVKYYIVKGINIQVGPQIGLLQKAEENFFDYDGDGAGGRDKFTDVKKDYANSDFSLAIGAGWDLPFGLTADVRYVHGLKDIYIYGGSDGKETGNRIFQISVGYKILKFGN